MLCTTKFLPCCMFLFLTLSIMPGNDVRAESNCNTIKDKAKRAKCRQKNIKTQQDKLNKILEKLKSGNLSEADKKKELNSLGLIIILKEEEINELKSIVKVLKNQQQKVQQLSIKNKAMELHKARKAKLKKIKN